MTYIFLVKNKTDQKNDWTLHKVIHVWALNPMLILEECMCIKHTVSCFS